MTRSPRKQEDEAPKDEGSTVQSEAPSEDEAPKEETPVLPQPKVKSVRAVYVPVGTVNVHLVTPSGNEYNIKPREEFKIAAEDVAWFFYNWDWCFRQRLVRAADYKPTCGYHDHQVPVAAKAAAASTDESEE